MPADAGACRRRAHHERLPDRPAESGAISAGVCAPARPLPRSQGVRHPSPQSPPTVRHPARGLCEARAPDARRIPPAAPGDATLPACMRSMPQRGQRRQPRQVLQGLRLHSAAAPVVIVVYRVGRRRAARATAALRGHAAAGSKRPHGRARTVRRAPRCTGKAASGNIQGQNARQTCTQTARHI